MRDFMVSQASDEDSGWDEYEIIEEEIYTVQEFKEICDIGGFTDDDGYGNPIVNGETLSIEIYPSMRSALIPLDTTHIVWYNK